MQNVQNMFFLQHSFITKFSPSAWTQKHIKLKSNRHDEEVSCYLPACRTRSRPSLHYDSHRWDWSRPKEESKEEDDKCCFCVIKISSCNLKLYRDKRIMRKRKTDNLVEWRSHHWMIVSIRTHILPLLEEWRLPRTTRHTKESHHTSSRPPCTRYDRCKVKSSSKLIFFPKSKMRFQEFHDMCEWSP